MCCVQNAGEGGETTFIDGEQLVLALETEAPDLLQRLQTVPVLHERSGDRRLQPIIQRQAAEVRLNWNYYCVSAGASTEALRLRQQFFEFLQSSPAVSRTTVGVKLATGDAVTWNDDAVLHGRNSFRASAESERFLWKCAVDVGVFSKATS